jgi:hypothetical protein
VLHRIELGDPAGAHLLCFGEGFLGEDLFELRERFSPRDQETVARRRDLQSASAPAVRTRVADT